MKLNLAAGSRGKRGGGQPRDLTQKFFQGFLVFKTNAFRSNVLRSSAFGGDGLGSGAFGRSFSFAEKFPGETVAGSSGQTQGHFTASCASSDDRVPDVGITYGQRLNRDFESGCFSGGCLRRA